MKKEEEKTIITDLEIMNSLMENIPDSIYFKDINSKFIKISQALVGRLKLNNIEEAFGKTDFDFFSKKHAEKAFQDEQNIIKTGMPLLNIEEKETYEGREDKWVSTTKMPLYNKKGEIIGTFGISRDITDIKKARENLKFAKIEAEKATRKAIVADSAKSDFLANMSHEIRTPMNAIMGFSEILKEQLSDPKHAEYIDIIMTSGKTLLGLINDILDLSKIEAGKMEFQYRPLDPHALFGDIVKIFAAKIKSKGLKLITDIDAKLPASLLLDEVRMRQILFNIVGNAAKFTSEGYIELKVKGVFHPDRSKIDLIFSIKDTGIGISEEGKKIVFDAFRQSSGQSTKKYGGTGLGLAITKKLIELMNGEITVESVVGKGSVFKVKMKEVSIASLEHDIEERKLEDEDISFYGQKVLVVDDIESNRLLLNEVLNIYGLNVLEAVNGKEAINIAQNQGPDIILMDLRMPVMDGYEAIKILKADRKLKDIPVVVLTASAMKSTEEDIKKINCNGYLRKPVSRPELILELKKYLKYDIVAKDEMMQDAAQAESAAKGKTGIEPEDNLNGLKTPKKPLEISAQKLSELISMLENEISARHDKLKKEFIINDIEDFAQEMQELGRQYGANILTEWGKKLSVQAGSFDLENLTAAFDEFENILKTIKSFKEE